MAKKKKEIIPEKTIISTAMALQNLADKVIAEGEDYDAEMKRPSERSEDTWGLKSVAGAYKSSRTIHIIKDVFGKVRVNTYEV